MDNRDIAARLKGRIVIELAPQFAPNHVTNVKRLARAGFFDGLSVVRAQDDYVAQWGDANSTHPTGEGKLRLKAEFDREGIKLHLPRMALYGPLEAHLATGAKVAACSSNSR